MWLALFKRYWQVSLIKDTPASTPCSLLMLCMIAGIFFLLIVVQWMLADFDGLFTLNTALVEASILLLSYAIYTLGLLRLFRVSYRTVQSLSCLLAGHTIVHLFAFPLLLIAPYLALAALPPILALLLGIVYLLLTIVFSLWQFMISVHIYKQALSVAYFPAVLASFGLVACNILMVSFWR